MDAFEKNTERRGDCLIWTGSVTGAGYGQITVDGKRLYAHRYAWERANGPIPDGMSIDHREHCDTRCVEVKHLRIATHAQNIANRSGAQVNNKSTGVRNVKPNRKGFIVRIKKDGKERYFGTYPTIEEAAQVAREKRRELFGEFAGEG